MMKPKMSAARYRRSLAKVRLCVRGLKPDDDVSLTVGEGD
jgi:hypothetical protein